MVPKSATLHILITDNGSIAIIIKVLFLGDLAQPGYCGEEGSWNKCQRLSAASQGGGFFTGENAMWHQAVRITVAVTPTWQYWILNYPFCCTHCRRNSQCFSVGQTIPKIAPCHGGFQPQPIHGSLGRHESAPKWHLNRFSRFCAAHPCDQHTDTQTTLCATYTVTGCIYAMRVTWPKMSKRY